MKEYRRLAASRRFRRAAGELALEGPNLLREALAAGLAPRVVFYTWEFCAGEGGDWLDSLPGPVRRYLVPRSVFDRLAYTETPRAVAGIVPYREAAAAELAEKKLSLALLLDRLQDPGNVGTILRSAAAAGAEAVFYTPGCADPYGPKALRSTAGALFRLALAEAREPLRLLAELKKGGLQVLAARPRTGQSFWEADLRRPTLLLIGSESGGLDPALEEAADGAVSVPQAAAVDSLNAAAAAAVLLFEAVRQRARP